MLEVGWFAPEIVPHGFLGAQLIGHAMHPIVMTRAAQQVQDRYDVLMFAKDRESARKAAGELVRLVLGPEADELSLQEAMRETCRRIRPSADPREQQRFENEFIELAIWPDTSQSVAA